MSSLRYRRSHTAEALMSFALIVAITSLSILAVTFVAPLRQAALWLDDLRLSYLLPLEAQSEDIVVLAIDEATLRDLRYRSPIDRGFVADLVSHLSRIPGIRAIGVDMIFDQQTTHDADRQLREALVHSAVPLVVAAGESSTGLTEAQVAFQRDFLAGVRQGTSVFVVENGIVRTYHPYSPSSLAPTFVHELAAAAGMPQPDASLPIRYRRAATDNRSPIRTYPAHSASLLPAGWFDNRVVLIGADLPDRNQHRTPLSVLGSDHEFMSGVQIHAQVLAQLASGAGVPQLSTSAKVIVVLLAVGFGLLIVIAPLAPSVRISIALLGIAGLWLAGFTAGLYEALPLPLIEPTLGFAFAIATETAIARQRERRHRLFLHGAFNQYVSPQIIDDILENPEHLELGGELRDMSFIFTDIADFSALAERLEPPEVVALLTGYLDGVVEIAMQHRGTIARFIGDALVIFFGAPLPDDEHRSHALRCAIEIDEYCEAYRCDARVRDHGLGVTRIGVHAGEAVVGNIGGRRRFEYTAHGDAVNLAARLETANRHFGTRICLSGAIANSTPDGACRPIGHAVVKGRSRPATLYTIWHDLSAEDRQAYLAAYLAMEAGDERVLATWEALARRLPEDALVRFHLHRLRSGERGAEFALGGK